MVVVLQDYFTVPKFFFNTVGLNPYFELTESLSRRKRIRNQIWFLCSLFVLTYAVVGEAIYFVLAFGKPGANVLELFGILPCTSLGVVALNEMALIIRCGDRINNLMVDIEEVFLKTKEEQDRFGVESAYRRNRIGIYNFTLAFFSLIMTFNALPLIFIAKDFSQTGVWRKEFPFLMWFPFDATTPIVFPIIYGLECWAGFGGVFHIVAVNIFFTSTLSVICLQFDILSETFRDIDPTKDKVVVKKELVMFVQRHNRLIDITKEAADIFSISILVNYLSSSIILCLAGFEIVASTDYVEILKFVLFLLSCLVLSLNMSLVGNRLLDSVSF